jgi:hypothetical protein
MIRAQLKRVLGASPLQANERRSAFLRYVVDETLAGRAERLKGYNIAVEALGRDETFNPQTDPVVRLEARQLRNDLAHYFLNVGPDDPVRIDIPKGGYVPTFAWTVAPPAASSASPTAIEVAAKGDRRLRRGLIAAAVGVGCLAAGVLGTWQILSIGSQDPSIAPRFTENSEAYALFLETRQLGRRLRPQRLTGRGRKARIGPGAQGHRDRPGIRLGLSKPLAGAATGGRHARGHRRSGTRRRSRSGKCRA